MTDIPEDVLKLAQEAREAFASPRDTRNLVLLVADAILADRKALAKAEPVAWRWMWKTTGSPLEQRFADPDLYMWTYRESEPTGDAAKKMDIQPLYATQPDTADRIRQLEAEVAELTSVVKRFINIMQHCSVTDGSCCCGEDMATHSAFSGHSPTDHGWYVADQALEDAIALIAKHGEKE